jgi:hypothetical protein
MLCTSIVSIRIVAKNSHGESYESHSSSIPSSESHEFTILQDPSRSLET